MIKIHIGYDDRMPILHSVLMHSIISRSSQPVSITPINLKNIRSVFHREIDPNQSTQFSFSRFLVPYLCNYEGWAIFMDNDMICLSDINLLWEMRDSKYSVMCVKHEYAIKEKTKFLGEKQLSYSKKNWSSMMLFNNSACRMLTPEYVNTATGLNLHQFKWLASDDCIGQIPKEWNYLSGYYPKKNDVSLVHFTDGGPYFKGYQNVDYADLWLNEEKKATYIVSE